MKLYKSLSRDGRSCHGGNAEWSLPKKSVDGRWEPGEWMEEIEGELELCSNGYHLCNSEQLILWLGARIFEAEHKGEIKEGEDKQVVRRCRLVRECEGWNEKTARLFACWCVRNTPLGDGRKVWELMTDGRSREAVEVSERYARGEASEEELEEARDGAWAVASVAAWESASAVQSRELYRILKGGGKVVWDVEEIKEVWK